MNICYENLSYIEDYINEKYGFSYARLDEMEEHDILDQILDIYSIHKCYKEELEYFINLLYTDALNHHEYLRKILLYESSYIKLFKKHGYILSLFLKNKDAYRVFPLFLKTSIDKYKLEDYQDLTLEEIDSRVNKYIDLNYRYDHNLGKNVVDVVPKYKELFTNYELYDYKLSVNDINFNNQTDFFIWAEYNTFIKEKQKNFRVQ